MSNNNVKHKNGFSYSRLQTNTARKCLYHFNNNCAFNGF